MIPKPTAFVVVDGELYNGTEFAGHLNQTASGLHAALILTQYPRLVYAILDLLEIVEFEYEHDPEREDLKSWKRAMHDAALALRLSGLNVHKLNLQKPT
jgi:hypothetical protein